MLLKLFKRFVTWLKWMFLWYITPLAFKFLPIKSKIKDKVLHTAHRMPKNYYDYPKLDGNIAEFILKSVNNVLQRQGDSDWQINGPFEVNGFTSTCGAKRIKISEIENSSRKIATAFYNAGLRKGQTVEFVIPNCTNYHVIVFGAWLCEGIVSLADPGLSLKVLKAHLQDTNATFVVCYDGSRNTVYQALKQLDLLGKIQVIVVELACPKDNQDLPIIQESESNFQFLNEFVEASKEKEQPPSLQNGPLDDNDVALILWSSGTTGISKGIQHTVKYMRKCFHRMNSQLTGINWSTLTTTCYFHVGGFITPIQIIGEAKCFIFNHAPDMDNGASQSVAESLYREIDIFKPLYLLCGSHHIVQLCQQNPKDKSLDLSYVRMVSPTGSTVPPTTYQDLKKNFKNLVAVINAYGMTEFVGYWAAAVSTDVNYLGGVAPGSVVKIVDPKTGEICGPHEVGEIMVKMDVVMKGYLNRPEENAKFFAKDGFVHTGDLGHYNENGTLYFDGRHKELIKYKNCHLYPLEIENVIRSHPDVLETGVFGKPDPLVQEYVTAAVVKVPGSALTEQEIIDLVANNVDDAKKLRGGVIFVDKIPTNPVGKIQRKKLIELLN